MIEEIINWTTDGSLPVLSSGDLVPTYLVQTRSAVGEAFTEEGAWYWMSGGSVQEQVQAWAPLPKGPPAPDKRGHRKGKA